MKYAAPAFTVIILQELVDKTPYDIVTFLLPWQHKKILLVYI